MRPVSPLSRRSTRSFSVRHGRYIMVCRTHPYPTEKTIHDEEVSNVDVAESMAELKVGANTTKERVRIVNPGRRTNLRHSTLPSATRISAKFRISSNNSRSALAKSARSMQPLIASRVSMRSSRSVLSLFLCSNVLIIQCSVPSPLLRQVLRAARTSLKALKTWNVRGRRSAFNLLSLMELRSLS